MNYLFRPSYNRVELLFAIVGSALLVNGLIGFIGFIAVIIAGGIISGTGLHFVERRQAR